jgi:ferritin-like metal-binding protein YciE
MRKAENKITKEEQAKMEKIADEMVAEPKTPTGENKKNANQMLHVMKSICSDDKQMKELQATAYAQVVEQDGFMEDVEKWSSDMMTRFLDSFEELYKETTGNIDNVEKVFDVEGGDDVNWKENPASEKQLKWVNDIVSKATDQNAEFLAELKEMYGDGNINGEVASQIIDKYSNQV